jgi:phosphoribosylformimino-5-aminoimidazole carboxamide ribotide isomerase
VTAFRPCIDLHQGQVKQIVGRTLRDDGPGPVERFVSTRDAAWYAERYREDGLRGGHVIRLGPGNDDGARAALAAWPGGLQLGGGVRDDDAEAWLEAGASHVIVTSWLFVDGKLDLARARTLARRIGRERLVIDLSCTRADDAWRVATDRWQTTTDVALGKALFDALAEHCSELLVHAADVEGSCEGIDEALVAALAEWSPLPCTYAGGARSVTDLDRVHALSGGRIDLTFGSSLDIFGGTLVRYADCVAWTRARRHAG